jgi:hypothetical protein
VVVLEDGRDLPTVAGVPERSTFDSAELHQALAAIPAGRWTTYRELAALIGPPHSRLVSTSNTALTARTSNGSLVPTASRAPASPGAMIPMRVSAMLLTWVADKSSALAAESNQAEKWLGEQASLALLNPER